MMRHKLALILILFMVSLCFSQPIGPRMTKERLEDYVGAMLAGAEILISVGYDDVNGLLNFVVDEVSIDHNALTNFDVNEHIDWTDASSRLKITLTTEQMRLAYDVNNYVTFTVDSNGHILVDFVPGSGDVWDFGGIAHIRCGDIEGGVEHNTKITLGTESMIVEVGGLTYWYLSEPSLPFAQDYGSFNSTGLDIDFIVEAVNQPHALFVQGSDGYVGINNDSPTSILDVNGVLTVAGNVIPGANDTYDLGDPNNRWQDLYMMGGSIYLGSITIEDTNGCLATNEFHAHGKEGVSGYYKLAHGTTPSAHKEAGHSILWVDINAVAYFEEADGNDRQIIIADVNGAIQIADGSASAPAYSFSESGQQDVGMFRVGSDLIGFTVGGISRVKVGLDGLYIVDGYSLLDGSGNKILVPVGVDTASNEFTITNAASGDDPEISATGGMDDNIGIKITPKGTGGVGIGVSPSSRLHIKAITPGIVGNNQAGQLIIQHPDDNVNSNAVITGYESDSNGNPDQQLWYLGSSAFDNQDILFLNRRNASLSLGTNGSTRVTISGGGNVFINDTANAKMATGLTINQGGADDEILTFKSSDIGHYMITVTENDTFGIIKKVNADQGGLNIRGLSDGDNTALMLQGFIGASNPTDSMATIKLRGQKWNGTTGVVDLGTAETILDIQNGTNTKFSFLGDGSFVSLGTYSKDVGATTRDLLVDDAGLIGYQASSFRYKKNIRDMGDASSRIYDLRPVSFNWKKSDMKDYGLIAEEVAEVMPMIITLNDSGRPETVEYKKLIPFLINELQNQQKQINELEKRIEKLERPITNGSRHLHN